jgi:cobalamin 5'-phosphate synthase/cobalamin synthase
MNFDGADVGRATLAFPIVGALLGGATFWLGRALRPLPPSVSAILLVGFVALATGALHLDGLADTADGFGGGKSRDDILRIMKDHAIGAYGATALILILLLKVALVGSLMNDWRGLVLAPMIARWASVPLCKSLPYARETGLAKALGDHVGTIEIVGATFLCAAASWFLGEWRGAGCMLAVSLLSILGAIVCAKKIGGITGDTLGANTELSEALVYLVWLAWQR